MLGASVAVDTHLAALDNTGGTIASIDGTLSIDSGALNNARGLLQSRQGMHVDTHAQTLTNTYAGSTGGILSGDTLALSSGNLNNRDGVVYSQGSSSPALATSTIPPDNWGPALMPISEQRRSTTPVAGSGGQ